jgi:hypothetical protein
MRNPWKLTSLLLAGTLATAVTTSVVQADRQPRMHDALKLLNKARTTLKNADNDKGGHRVKAIELVDAAIAEVDAGIKFDNRH